MVRRSLRAQLSREGVGTASVACGLARCGASRLTRGDEA
jgi:hypothetical protein